MLRNAAETPLDQLVLAVRAGVLTAGQQYVFRATATGAAAGLTADVAVAANAPPRGGTFAADDVTPTCESITEPCVAFIGVGRFVLRASGWADSASDLPLTYEFYAGVDAVRRCRLNTSG